MSSSLDLFLRRLRDPRWIPHISDYCDSRCERCAFVSRCWSYALRQHGRLRTGARTGPTEARPRACQVSRASRHRRPSPRPPAKKRPTNSLRRKSRRIPLASASDYGDDVWRVIQPMAPAERKGLGWAAPGSGAQRYGDVWGLALVIGAKTHRAISSIEYNRHEDFEFETDAIQTDANGSAKVARLAAANSLIAWAIVQSSGLLDAGLVTLPDGQSEADRIRARRAISPLWPLSGPASTRHFASSAREEHPCPAEDDEEEGTEDWSSGPTANRTSAAGRQLARCHLHGQEISPGSRSARGRSGMAVGAARGAECSGRKR